MLDIEKFAEIELAWAQNNHEDPSIVRPTPEEWEILDLINGYVIHTTAGSQQHLKVELTGDDKTHAPLGEPTEIWSETVPGYDHKDPEPPSYYSFLDNEPIEIDCQYDQ